MRRLMHTRRWLTDPEVGMTRNWITLDGNEACARVARYEEMSRQ